MIDLRKWYPSKVRHCNRNEPMRRIPRRKPDIYLHDDGLVSLAHLTDAEARRLYALAVTDVHLYSLTYALGEMLGIDDEVTA